MPEKIVAIGRKLPNFSAPSTAGTPFRLLDRVGRAFVIYFYPRDNTSGCTREGLAFRELQPKFAKLGVDIVGVSPDGMASHEKFKAKYQFAFELLADEEQKLCKLFDVIKEKSMYGRKYMGVERSSFLVDARGVLRQEWRKVKVDGHAREVLEAAASI